MDTEFDFLAPGDKPALVAFTNYEWLASVQSILSVLEYKVHVAGDHSEFLQRFNAVQYQILVMDECFASKSPAENQSLQTLQRMAMAQRRHTTTLLVGANFQTLHPWQAYANSVHAVVNQLDLPSLGQIIRMVNQDNGIFLSAYREVQQRILRGEVR